MCWPWKINYLKTTQTEPTHVIQDSILYHYYSLTLMTTPLQCICISKLNIHIKILCYIMLINLLIIQQIKPLYNSRLCLAVMWIGAILFHNNVLNKFKMLLKNLKNNIFNRKFPPMSVAVMWIVATLFHNNCIQ